MKTLFLVAALFAVLQLTAADDLIETAQHFHAKPYDRCMAHFEGTVHAEQCNEL